MDTQTEMNRNWSEEVKKLSESAYLKMEKGITYSVLFLDEGGAEYERKPFPGQSGTPRRAVDFRVKVTGGGMVGKEQVWTVTKALRKDSVWGMLSTLFEKSKKAAGFVVDVTATGDGKEKKYHIKQYNDLLFLRNQGL
jgi:hypothetical protein